jgi:hypothetical protein
LFNNKLQADLDAAQKQASLDRMQVEDYKLETKAVWRSLAEVSRDQRARLSGKVREITASLFVGF